MSGNNDVKKHKQRLSGHILRILMTCSDEKNTLKRRDIDDELRRETGEEFAADRRLIAAAIDAVTEQMNIDGAQRIGYKEDKLSRRTDFYYRHAFSFGEMDKLIEAVMFSSFISEKEKTSLVGKLAALMSKHYSTPFYSGRTKKLTANNNAIFSRTFRTNVSENIGVIQSAVKSDHRIRFTYNVYDKNSALVPYKEYVVSPYQILVYHDLYYLICGVEGSDRLWHFQIDRMTDIEPARKSSRLDPSKEVHVVREGLRKYEDLRERGTAKWQPAKYMADHLYMVFDEPRKIHMRVAKNSATILHNWFGSDFKYYEREGDFDDAEVVTSPSMIVFWALQYPDHVEITDEDIREEIRKKLEVLRGKYGEGA